MAREKETQAGPNASYVEIDDIDGKKVRIPLERAKGEYASPMQDADGTIPEFVNVSGIRQQMVIPNDPSNTIKIEPWGILKGAQWRSFSEPSKAWGRTPKFIERIKNKDGNYDQTYLLTEKQAIDEISRLNNCDPGFTAYAKLDGWAANGKVHQIDSMEQVINKDYTEDRGAVLTAISKQQLKLKKAWDIEKKNRGMSGIG